MRRAPLAALIVVAVFTSPVSAQNRPDLTGKWMLIGDGTTLASRGALGPAFTVAQDASTITFELVVEQIRGFYSPTQGSRLDVVGTSTRRESHRLDGAETVQSIPTAVSEPPRGLSYTTDEAVSKAAWMGDTLVIVTHRMMKTTASQGEPIVRVRQTLRRVFSLDPNGTLTVESLIIADPKPTDVAVHLPGPVRSVYRRAG